MNICYQILVFLDGFILEFEIVAYKYEISGDNNRHRFFTENNKFIAVFPVNNTIIYNIKYDLDKSITCGSKLISKNFKSE